MDGTEVWPPPEPLGEALHPLRMDGAFYCRSELRVWGVTLHPNAVRNRARARLGA